MLYNICVEIVNLRQPNSQNIIFKYSKEHIENKLNKYWDEYELKLHNEYPGLIKLRYFHNNHPLKQNYENFMKYKRQQVFDEQKRKLNNIPVLKISWTGAHYEPVNIKNHHHLLEN